MSEVVRYSILILDEDDNVLNSDHVYARSMHDALLVSGATLIGLAAVDGAVRTEVFRDEENGSRITTT